ncbi:MAG TPA: GNAT family N-acetyltransferase [Pseudoduganella sp.]|jgi:GNAT superfamily N-acetyltransferase
MITIDELSGDGIRAAADELAEVLRDCVAHGASVGFLPPVTKADARRFWLDVAQQADAGARTLFAARGDDGAVRGTVQLALATPANGAHRAEVNKMLVHTRYRRQGIGQQLLLAAEARARALGRTLLVLDTWSAAAPSTCTRDWAIAPPVTSRSTRSWREARWAPRASCTRCSDRSST